MVTPGKYRPVRPNLSMFGKIVGSPFIGFRSWLFNFHFLNRRSFGNFSNYYREVIRSWSIMNCEFVRTQTRDGFANLARLICGVNSPVMTYKNIHIHVTAYIGIPFNYKGVWPPSFQHMQSEFVILIVNSLWICDIDSELKVKLWYCQAKFESETTFELFSLSRD